MFLPNKEVEQNTHTDEACQGKVQAYEKSMFSSYLPVIISILHRYCSLIVCLSFLLKIKESSSTLSILPWKQVQLSKGRRKTELCLNCNPTIQTSLWFHFSVPLSPHYLHVSRIIERQRFSHLTTSRAVFLCGKIIVWSSIFDY